MKNKVCSFNGNYSINFDLYIYTYSFIYQFISGYGALYIRVLLQFQRPAAVGPVAPRPGEPPVPRIGDLFIGDLAGEALPPFVNVIRPV